MTRHPYDAEALLAAGCTIRQVGDDRVLVLPGGDQCRFRVDNGDMILFPERSAAHKKLLGFVAGV
jgi:hypothetical protein